MSAYNSRPGAWTCGNCHYVNIATKRECKRCNVTKINQASGFSSEEREGNNQQHWRSIARGARFGERSEDRGNGQKSGSTQSSEQRKKREYPMGYKALEKMLEEDPDQIVMHLLRENSGYDLLLEKSEEITEDKMCLLMQVLVRATGTRANRESLNIVMKKTFQSKFNNHLLNFALQNFNKYIDHRKVSKYFENLGIVLDKFAHAMPILAMDEVFVLVESCLMYLKQRGVHEFSEVIAMYEETESFLENLKKKWQSQNDNGARRSKGSWQDNLQPPENTSERNDPCLQKRWEDCRPCVVQVPKTFPCGCVHKVAFSKYDFNHKCPTVVQRELPDCHHEAAMKCCEDPSIFPCPTPCEIRLPCGHKCTRKCHVKDDPNHFNFQCEKACPRSPEGCLEEHKCDKACYEVCGPCIMPAKKKAVCGHINDVHCSTPQENIKCNRKCQRVLPCEHHCPKKCKDPCGGCTVKVKKIIPDCRHEIVIECGKPAVKTECSKRCTLHLPCGHQCQARCKEPCSSLCKGGVLINMKCPKGHKINVPCYLLNIVAKMEAWIFCEEPCGTELDCKHYCKGKCGQCLHGRLHIACSEKCGRTLTCGHICKADCSSACPPCQAPCPMRCMHSRCGKKCGEPCSPCQEECSEGCSHQKCSNPCWKPCTQALCKKPCPKKLKCGHPCVGYCGDPCPPLCRICDKDDLTELLFGSEDEDDARFVLLKDCGHVLEAEGLQGWLSQNSGEIGMKFCPRCRKPIYNNRRNHDAILKTYKNVRAVKAKYYDKNPKQAMQEINELWEEMETLTGNEVDQIKSCLPNATPTHTQQIYHTISDSEISLYRFQVQVVKRMNTLRQGNPHSSREFKSLSTLVMKRVMEQKLLIAPQMVEEITCEIQHLNILPVYWQLNERVNMLRHPELISIKNTLDLLMNPTIRFDKEQERKVKRKLKESEQYVGRLGITNNERLAILNAMGLMHGHWYKCPIGHIYCIIECDTAMVEARCPECGVSIGGQQDTLRTDNAVATEMYCENSDNFSQHLLHSHLIFR